MTLYLVRHGRPSAGLAQLDPGLDTLGVAQANDAARALAAVGARRLVVSPLRRTRETAQPIAEALGLVSELRAEVAEVFEPSIPAPIRQSTIGPLLAGRWTEQAPELRRWRERVVGALLELGEETAIVVSHFVAISVAIGEATGDDRVAPCPLAHASITALEVRGGHLELVRPGDVSHLAPDRVTATQEVLSGKDLGVP